MDQKLQNRLFTAYPKIFKQKDLSADQTAMCWGINTDDGWYGIINLLCKNIQNYLNYHNGEGSFIGKTELQDKIPQVEAVQVKEKLGSLRFYIIGGDDYIKGLISMTEAISKITCEICGNLGAQSRFCGWIRCEDCRLL